MRLLAVALAFAAARTPAQSEAELCGQDFETVLLTEYERQYVTRSVELGPLVGKQELEQMEFNMNGAGIETVETGARGLSGKLGSTTVTVGPRYDRDKLELSCFTSREIDGLRREAASRMLIRTPIPDLRETIRACPALLEKKFEQFERSSKLCPVRRRLLDREWKYRNVSALRELDKTFWVCFHERTRNDLLIDLARMGAAVQGAALTQKDRAVIAAALTATVEEHSQYTSSDVVDEKTGAQIRSVVFNWKWSGANNPFAAQLPPITDKKLRVVVATLYAERDSGKQDIGALVFDSAPVEQAAIAQALQRTRVEARARLHQSALVCERPSRAELCKDQ
jgi:hypothetical protein